MSVTDITELKHIPELKTLADLIKDEAVDLEIKGYVNPDKFSQWEIWNCE